MKRNFTNMADEKNNNFLDLKDYQYGICLKRSKDGKSSVLEANALNFLGAKLRDYLIAILKEELIKNYKISKYKKILIVGLGNKDVFNDSLGPLTIEKLIVSRGLDLKPEVSVIAPNVYSNTGIETFDIVKAVVKIVEPELVILIDSLATLSVSRLCGCIQISKNGISAGSGLNSNNKLISKSSLKVKQVISIGVPMLIYAEKFFNQDLKSKTQTIQPLILSPVNIKQNLKLVSEIISGAINMSIFKSLTKQEIDALIN